MKDLDFFLNVGGVAAVIFVIVLGSVTGASLIAKIYTLHPIAAVIGSLVGFGVVATAILYVFWKTRKHRKEDQ